jgi:hypothetical protein
VEPRLLEVDVVARAGAALPLVVAPAMSLKRFVVPRVAPMLDVPEELDRLDVEGLLEEEFEVLVEELELVATVLEELVLE